MNTWDRPEKSTTSRLIAALWLLNQADEALTETPRRPGDSALAEGGRPAGRPPAPAQGHEYRDMEALLELAYLLTRGDQADGAELRRTAELCELFDRDDMARVYWQRAAELGDEDAQSYLEVLEEEEDEFPERRDVYFSSPEDALRRLVVKVSMTQEMEAMVCMPSSMSPDIIYNTRPPEVSQKLQDRQAEIARKTISDIDRYIHNPDHITDGGRL